MRAIRVCAVYMSVISGRLTQALVLGELLVDLLHALDVEAAGGRVVDHGLGVVHPHHTVARPLQALWGRPRLVDVTVWVVLQLGDVLPLKTKAKCRASLSLLCNPRPRICFLKSYVHFLVSYFLFYNTGLGFYSTFYSTKIYTVSIFIEDF